MKFTEVSYVIKFQTFS